jgi:diamine N-acetyltransferase
MQIKLVDKTAIIQLQQIGIQTFVETFAAQNTAADMQQYLENSFAEKKLLKELSTTNTAFYIAEIEEQVVGYLKINWGKAQTELQDDDALEIERIYVLQHYHGKQVGQALYNFAQQIAIDKHATYIWLGVWEHNARAKQFYTKNGFTAFGSHVFMLGTDAQTDVLMRKEL